MSIFSYCRSSRYVSCVCHRMSKIHPHTYTHLWLSVCTYKYILPHTHTYIHRYHIISSKFVNFVPAIQPCPLRFRNLPHEAGEERSLARYLGVIASIRQPLQCCPKTNKNCTILSINKFMNIMSWQHPHIHTYSAPYMPAAWTLAQTLRRRCCSALLLANNMSHAP